MFTVPNTINNKSLTTFKNSIEHYYIKTFSNKESRNSLQFCCSIGRPVKYFIVQHEMSSFYDFVLGYDGLALLIYMLLHSIFYKPFRAGRVLFLPTYKTIKILSVLPACQMGRNFSSKLFHRF